MKYIERINKELKPFVDDNLDKTVIDLFAGCGGLSLGFEAMGFKTIGYEKLDDAAETYRNNLIGDCYTQELETSTEFPKADVVIGGPPCQPFSVGGKQLGLKDSRDGFPIFISAIEKVEPSVFLFENVRGLLYKNKWYLKEVIDHLQNLGYIVTYRLLNAKHYGVPQNRERVIVIGSRNGLNFPKKLNNKVTAGEALGDMAKEIPEDSKFLTPSMDKYIAKYEKASHCINPRDLHLDKPARTLTCRNLAGATGDMHRVRLPDGRRRRLTTEEAKRLQSFPDWFQFHGNETSVYNQIGNAVAPYFAMSLAREIKNYYLSQKNGNRYPIKDENNQLLMFHES
ncbi:MAG: cytosine-specific methyltransferase [Saprospiraceae bacterium]|nr:MAG: cytosine-specific methyltransferase [Saprospiraceae bacterium]